MFNEPTKGDLKSACGWTLVRRSETTPEHVVALDKYRDGCESLIPFAKGEAEIERCGEVKLPAPVSPPTPLVTVDAGARPHKVDPEFLAHMHVVSCDNGGEHRFNIDTQKCVFCGLTRLQALGRKPELMTQ